MDSLPEIFFRKASDILKQYPELSFEWNESSEKKTLKILKNENSGFDIEVECETYGLYPSADGWHGAAWDSTTPNTTFEELSEDCLGFVRSLLCSDSKLTVLFSNGKPYKWILSYPIDGSIVDDETGLILFNFFGKRTRVEFQNKVLPSREENNL
ncbi:MAG: hypothetical protein KDD34_07920 [Bdellovibrionales bacterium]|nr:hypothetical protein [Bdellovibrionales bacterium]